MASANQSHIYALLNRVKLALKAIETGDFGYCRQCDEPIAWLRFESQAGFASVHGVSGNERKLICVVAVISSRCSRTVSMRISRLTILK
jgi:hypothetical protein